MEREHLNKDMDNREIERPDGRSQTLCELFCKRRVPISHPRIIPMFNELLHYGKIDFIMDLYLHYDHKVPQQL